MKTLTLLRHAKSGYDDPLLRDFDRPLNDRGRRAAMTIGGWLQGMAMLDASRPFIDSVTVTLPYLEARTVGGGLMVLGHFVFVSHVAAMAFRFGPRRTTAALFRAPLSVTA